MSLAPRVAHYFGQAVKKKGRQLADGAVEIENTGETGVEATVAGSYRSGYSVYVDWSDLERIEASCACPHYDDGNFCKHLWATILEADAAGYTEALPEQGSLQLVHDYDDECGDDQYGYEEEDWIADEEWEEAKEFINKTATIALNQALGVNGKKTATKNASWQQQLSAVHANRAGSPPANASFRPGERRIEYVLDVGMSFESAAPQIQLFYRTKKKDGTWGKAKPLKLRRRELPYYDPLDQQVFAYALGNRTRNSHGYNAHAYDYYEIDEFEISSQFYDLLLPLLCETGRFGWVLSTEVGIDDFAQLAWDNGPAWKLGMEITKDKKKQQWNLVGELLRPHDQDQVISIPITNPVIILSNGIAVFPDHVARFDSRVDQRWLKVLRANDQIQVPYADREKLLAEVFSSPFPPNVDGPDNLQPAIAAGEPTGYLKINAAEKRGYNYQPQHLLGELGYDYGLRRLRGDEQSTLVGVEDDHVYLRNGEAELQLLDQLDHLGVEAYQDRYDAYAKENIRLPRTRFTEIVRELTKLGWHVEAEGAQVRTAGDFNISVTSGVDWFDLESDIDFGEASATLPELLAAAKSDDGYIELSDGSRGLLPEQWLEKFAPLAELAEVHEGKLRFRPSQALLLDALLAERAEESQVQLDRQFQQFREKLGSFSGVAPQEAPRGFQGELREYQQEGLGWLNFLQEFNLGGCLADDMGLGKTVQVLALLQSRRAYRLKKGEKRLPSLVVAPKSVAGNWIAEAERFAPKLEVLDYTGTDRHELTDQFDDANLIVTTYGTLRRDIEKLCERKFDYVILDESQAIKNEKSQSAKAARLLQAQHRLALTGTPIENHLGELWSQFEFLNPGMLGRSSAFRNFMRTNKNDDDETRQAQLAALKRAVAPFLLRRTKEEVLNDLPEKQEQNLTCELTTADRKRYNELRDHYRDSLLGRIDEQGMNKSKMHVLEALLRLRQAACHPGLIDKKLTKKKSAKLDMLLEQLEDVISGGHKALVFSQFTSMLAIVKDRLDKQKITYEYLDGKTRKRQEKVDRFQTDPNCPLFLISLKAGGTGLNLTAADYVFVLDPWWNPAVEAQAIDRAHRIGQTRRVFAYRLIAKDTVEEKILELQQQKRELADAIIDANESLLQQMTGEDLRLLLS